MTGTNSNRITLCKRLLDFFTLNHGVVFPSGELQKMQWHNKNGTLSTPSTVTRQLRALAEKGKIAVVEIKGHAHYSSNTPPKKKQVVTMIEIDGQQVARVTYE